MHIVDIAIIFIALVVSVLLVFVSVMSSEIIKMRKITEILFVRTFLDDEDKEELRNAMMEVISK